MIEHFTAERFRCLKSVSCALTPLHAFVGPNDSGKSTLLKAIVETVNIAAGTASSISMDFHTQTSIRAAGLEFRLQAMNTSVFHGSSLYTARARKSVEQLQGLSPVELQAAWAQLVESVRGGAWIARFDGEALRQSSQLVPPEHLPGFFVSRGVGLPGVYDLILGRGDKSFSQIQDQVYRLFPSVKRLGLLPLSNSHKTLQIELRDGSEVTSDGFSEGLLYYLAYAALSHLRRPSLLAIEEPENGLHPARVAEIIKLLRAMSEQGTQILIATHSR